MGQTFLDNFRYCLKQSREQSFLSWSKQAKKKASTGLSALPVFLATVSLKDIPSERTLQCLRSSKPRAEIRSGQVNTNRLTIFIEIALSDREQFFPKEIMYLIMTSTLQVWEYLGVGGCLSRAPLRNLVT